MQISQPTVNISGTQTITGAKSFSNTMTVSGTLIQGLGSGEFFAPGIHTVSATTTAGAVKHCDATAGAFNLTLPTASQDARIMCIKIDASANAVTILPPAGGTIGGAANYVLTARYMAVTLLYIGGNDWVIVGKT